ncbi:hypothetical protein [Bacillus taeanensis]|uniref:Uncharacterized protein n=1 Tax=Bacillus taeanensis TaxID=273032 RepID=A0A366XW56_9BACI|nr:hypothetical protein [Bacillus taeanensis]RBW68999.1 hypothetical protein DS031_13760 [Bacillus taeanensis]
MYPELNQFLKIKKLYDKELTALEEQKEAIEKRRNVVQSVYMDMLDKRSAYVPLSKLTEAKEKIEELTNELRYIIEKMRNVEKEKKERLKELLPSLITGKDREIGAVNRHLQKKKRELMRSRAEYLYLIQQLHEMRLYADEVDETYRKAAREINERRPTPRFEGISVHTLSFSHHEIQSVYETGKLPAWVEEILGNEDQRVPNDKELSFKLLSKK